MKALVAALGALALALAVAVFYYQGAASTVGDEIQSLQADNLELNQKVATLEQEKAELTGELETLATDKETLEAQLGQISQAKDATATELEALRTQQAELEQKIATLEKEKAATAAALESQVIQHSQLSTEKEEELARIKVAAERKQAEKDAEIARLRTTHDQLVSGMKQEIQQGQIKITQLADQLSVSLVDQILFPSGSADISPEGLKVMQRVGDIIKKARDKTIRVEGHTDNQALGWYLRNKFPTNWELSTQRANNVVRFLQEKVGIEGSHLKAVGMAEYKPIADNKTPEGRSKNRRIEITLESIR
ncbi:MAG: OmpA family protein [Gammaproteobacteria bacterium]|nr:OmpA family protein [Gammaproteobacteria bacterium]MBU1960044.1 OmpA family protein [Gammaproteobacteria bacterium]